MIWGYHYFWKHPYIHVSCNLATYNPFATYKSNLSSLLMAEILHHLGWLKPYK